MCKMKKMCYNEYVLAAGAITERGAHRVAGTVIHSINAWVAKLVDAQDLKSCGSQIPCRFKSGLRHQLCSEEYPSPVEGTGLENQEVGDGAGVRIPLSPPIMFIYRGMEQLGSSLGS